LYKPSSAELSCGNTREWDGGVVMRAIEHVSDELELPASYAHFAWPPTKVGFSAGKAYQWQNQEHT